MEEKMDVKAKTLSGGQKQRVAIAKAIIKKPKFMILDEPFSSLDNNTSKELIDILLKLKEDGMAILLTTHKTNYLEYYADRFIVLKEGEIEHISKDISLNGLKPTKYVSGLFNDSLVSFLPKHLGMRGKD
jgi:ABC-type multidrug transport system ATPase subunit